MFVFRGMVGEVLFRYAAGDGKHLQHVLGNMFRQERLEQQFDEWHLQQFARVGKQFDIQKHKHIFVYAIYGHVTRLDEDTRQWFISKYIIGQSDHLLMHKTHNRNLLAQADDIVQKTDERQLALEMDHTEDGLQRAKAVLSDGTVLCEQELSLCATKAANEARPMSAKKRRYLEDKKK